MNRIGLIATLLILLTVNVFSVVGQDAQAQPSLRQGTRDVEWNSQGTLLAVANPNGEIQVRSVDGETILVINAYENIVRDISWSSDGTQLASLGLDDPLRIWSIPEGNLVREINTYQEGLYAPAELIDWQPDGALIAASSIDTIGIWNALNGTLVNTLGGVTLSDLAWSPTASSFAYASKSRIGVVNISLEGTEIFPFDSFDNSIRAVNWNSDGTQLVSAGGEDGSIRLWNAQTGAEVQTLLQVDDVVNDAVFINADKIAAATNNGEIYIINTVSGAIEQTIHQDGQVWTLDWNPVADLLAVGGLSNVLPSSNDAAPDTLSASTETSLLDVISIPNS